MEFYFEVLINTTKDIKINQQLVIFNQWIVGKQLFEITIMCDYGHRFIGQLDTQRSIPYPKPGNMNSTTFYIWTSISCSTNSNFHWWKLLFPRASAPIHVLNSWVCFYSTRFYECPYDDLIWQWLSLASPWRANDDSPQPR